MFEPTTPVSRAETRSKARTLLAGGGFTIDTMNFLANSVVTLFVPSRALDAEFFYTLLPGDNRAGNFSVQTITGVADGQLNIDSVRVSQISSPVPEPSRLVLTGLALAGLLLRHKLGLADTR